MAILSPRVGVHDFEEQLIEDEEGVLSGEQLVVFEVDWHKVRPTWRDLQLGEACRSSSISFDIRPDVHLQNGRVLRRQGGAFLCGNGHCQPKSHLTDPPHHHSELHLGVLRSNLAHFHSNAAQLGVAVIELESQCLVEFASPGEEALPVQLEEAVAVFAPTF